MGVLYQPGLGTSSTTSSNDYHRLPVTDKQIRYARQIAEGAGKTLPPEVQQDRRSLSAWIDQNQSSLKTSPFSNYPSSKQVAFAERIARIKHSDIPHECFRDRLMMSRWIDSNKPRSS